MASFAVHVMAREFTGREDVITSSSEHSCHYESPRVNAMCVGLLWSSEPISCPRDHKSQDSIVYDVRWQVAHPSEYNDAAESRIAGLEASSMAGHCSLRMWNSLLHKSQQDAAEIDARVKSSASSTSLLSVLQTSATIAQTSPRDIVLAHGDLCTHDLRGMCHRQAPSSWRETSIRSSLSLMSSIDHEQRTLTPRVLGASKFSNDLDARRYTPGGASVKVETGTTMKQALIKVPLEGVSHPSSMSIEDRRSLSLVAGGSGFIGQLIGRWLALDGNYLSTAKLIGRSAKRSFTDCGGSAASGVLIYHMADLSFSEDVASVLRGCTSAASTIFQTSGSLADGTLANQTPSSLRSVFAPKAVATDALIRVGLSSAVQRLFLFSSMTAVFGAAGQSNYAMANADLDDRSMTCTDAGMPVTSAAWGAWGGASGMADDSFLLRMKRIGFGYLTPSTGMRAIEDVLRQDSLIGLQITVSPFDWATLKTQSFFVHSLITTYGDGPAGLGSADNRLMDGGFASDAMGHAGAMQPVVQNETALRLVQMDVASRRAFIIDEVSKALEDVLGVRVAFDAPLMEAGLDSLGVIEFGASIGNVFGITLSTTVAFDYPTIADVAAFIEKEILDNVQAVPSMNAAMRATHDVSADTTVTVISGMGCRFPVRSSSPEMFWDLIKHSGDAVSVVPKERWDVDLSASFGLVQRRKSAASEQYCRHGAFVTGIELFDSDFFGVPAEDAHTMDPQQKVLLSVTFEALHRGTHDDDVGNLKGQEVSVRDFRGSEIAVMVGICNNDFDTIMQSRVAVAASAGRTDDAIKLFEGMSETTYAFASNRISHVLGLQGPSMSVDTASSSSLVATHLARAEAERRGAGAGAHHRRAIAAGVHLMLHPALHEMHSNRMVAPKDGRCKTFDASADGWNRSEGCGAVVLQCLEENDMLNAHVVCVLRGSVVTHKGGGASLRAMRGPAISSTMKACLEQSETPPSHLLLMEATGLGDPHQDAMEVGAFGAVIGPRIDAGDMPLVLNCTHPNIAHLDGASGIASVIRTALVVEHQTFTSLVHFRSLHPLISANAESKAARFPRSRGPLIPTEGKNVHAGINSFGYGGTMSNVILESSSLMSSSKTVGPKRPPEWKNAVRYPWWKMDEQPMLKEAQRAGEGAAGHLENHIDEIIFETAGVQLPDGANLFDFLAREEAWRVVRELERQLHMEVDRDNIEANATVSKLAFTFAEQLMKRTAAPEPSELVSRLLQMNTNRVSVMSNRAGSRVNDDEGSSTVLHNDGDLLAFENSSRRALEGHAVLLLVSPCSGGSTMQAVLDGHPGLVSVEELNLLQFDSMRERRNALRLLPQNDGLREALRKIRRCSEDEASNQVGLWEKENASTADVFAMLQKLAYPRLLIDRSPAYMFSEETISRVTSRFSNTTVVHVVRHPFSAIDSAVDLVLDGIGDVMPSSSFAGAQPKVDGSDPEVRSGLWCGVELQWSTANYSVVKSVPDAERVKIEDLCAAPRETMARLLRRLGLDDDWAEGAAPDMVVDADEVTEHDFWDASVDGAVSPLGKILISELGYECPPWKCLRLPTGLDPRIVRMNSVTASAPAFVLHDATGSSVWLSRTISSTMPCPLFGINQLPGDAETVRSVDELARKHLVALRTVQPSGPITLLAYGFGCRVALAMGLLLQEEAQETCSLILVDGFVHQALDMPLCNPQWIATYQLRRGLCDHALSLDDIVARMESAKGASGQMEALSSLKPPAMKQGDWDNEVHYGVKNFMLNQRLATKFMPNGAFAGKTTMVIGDDSLSQHLPSVNMRWLSQADTMAVKNGCYGELLEPKGAQETAKVIVEAFNALDRPEHPPSSSAAATRRRDEH